jgi:hypothetical protein
MDDDMEEAEQQHGTGETFARRPAAAGGRFTKGQQAVEDLVASSLGQLGPLVSQAAILRCIRLSTSPEDLMERLALLFDDESASPRFRHVFEQALFAAEIMGYAHAEDPEALKRFAAPVVNVTAQFEPPPAPSIIVNVPEQPAPVVNVAAPELPAPIVNVTAEAAAPIVNVTAEVKPRLTETIIERDTEGNIVKATQADIPDERTLN